MGPPVPPPRSVRKSEQSSDIKGSIKNDNVGESVSATPGLEERLVLNLSV